ncbi:hypothetical protein HU200_035275 [Digitaria exilis]|uniref:Uncharacterized protein n=1 Tax=Digitaria exilis TaxID=1010633 RepID=A0A835BR55_9POAL|nr:hypothetical protein HU200_035275 [Digitaria exilis]CAB3495380.1 unnamed protein product [Digitaria exilis]
MVEALSTIGAPPTAPRSSGLSSTDADNIRFIEEITTNVDTEQERVLEEILSRHGESEYLVKCWGGGLTGDTSRATFRAKDLEPYIRRIADGDRSPILTGSGHPVTEIFTSSGTSGGERKMIPNVEDEVDRRYLLESLFATGKALYFLYVSSEGKTPGGLPSRTVMTSYYKSHQFTNSPFPRNNTSPTAAILCLDTFQSTYAQMVCGLCQRKHVMHIGAAFAVGVVRAIHFLQQHWEQLSSDIEAGKLNPSCVTDQSVREAVAHILQRPDPEVAKFIRDECSRGDWAGIIPRIWPNAKFLGIIVTGSMAQYIPTLNYYSRGLPMASDIYGASEGDFGLNLDPLCDPLEVSYTMMPNMAYFEFLPLDPDRQEDVDEITAAQQLVELGQLEAGHEYELVVTTYTGLNRYRVGDVLRVTGFHNATPMVRFVRRGNVLLSIDGEKTDEAELHRAVERAASLLLRPHGVAVAEYTSRVCTKDVPGHYVIYWELEVNNSSGNAAAVVDGDVLDRCCLEMEEGLSSVYRQKRVVDKSIAPLEIWIVRPGTFGELLDYAISRGTSLSQYKVPRCISESPPIIDLLDSCVMSNHFSSTLPQWAPDQQSNN